MDETKPDETPRVRKGWPKGKPRGPRKPPPPQPPVGDPPPPPQPPQPILSAYEPVRVDAIYKTGQVVQFFASAFEFTPTEYKFWSYPEQRGFKQLHVMQKAEVIAISVTAPERDFEALRQQPMVPPPPPPAPAGGRPAFDPYPSGDPQVSVAPRGRSRPVGASEARSSMVPTMGVPRSVGTVYEKGELVERTTDASMI